MSTDDTKTNLPRVHILNAAVDTVVLRQVEFQVIRGRLRPQYFDAMEVPPYQRRLIKELKHEGLIKALNPVEGIGVPDDLLLCARVERYSIVGVGEFVLPPQTVLYVLDGHQRYGAAMELLGRGQSTADFGVKIILGTSELQEVDLFYQVNGLQTKVSSNKHLDNDAKYHDIAALKALRTMAETTPGFPTVSWDSDRGGEITAYMLYEVAALLHGWPLGLHPKEFAVVLTKVAASIGTKQMNENVIRLFKISTDLVSERPSFGEHAHRVAWIKGLALLFGRYNNFWNGSKLTVRKPEYHLIGNVRSESFTNVITRSDGATAFSAHLREHINHGREKNRLVRREHPIGADK